jgi:NADH-quinone oxidoreductase subunit F
MIAAPQRQDGLRTRRHLVLPALHAVQDRFGWISPGALNYLSERLGVAPADVYGVATFYASISTSPRGARMVHVCDDIACMQNGSMELARSLESSGIEFARSPCLGLCDRAPAALVEASGEPASLTAIAPATVAALDALLSEPLRSGDEELVLSGNEELVLSGVEELVLSGVEELVLSGVEGRTHVGGGPLRLLRRVGRIDPQSLDDYRAAGGYAALRKAIEMRPGGVVAETIASNLLGRGGAAFPTGRKMESVAVQPLRPHYLICNADESEPGTFKDRVLMEDDPFAVIEGMTIAAYAAGCERAYIYIRGEYRLAAQRIAGAIALAHAAGLLGDNVMSSGVPLEIEVRRGAGAYICGEETALFNSIEGKRGEPRNKPPFPAQAGLFGKPTLINNVETLANLPLVILEGGADYARTGTPGSTGTRLFCLSGAVTQPGLYEVPHGTTLRALIELAGGVSRGRDLQAILLGGAAGTFVPPSAIEMPLTFEDARDAGTTLGSGVVMLFDTSTEMKPILRRIARFFREESCGQCVPCRVGTVRQEEALEHEDFALLDEIGRVMRDASICGLGQTAANAIASARKSLQIWPS